MVSIVALLLESQADPNLINPKAGTALTKAFDKGHHEIVDNLMQYDCELDEAMRQGHFEKIMALLETGSVNVQWASPSSGLTMLHHAAKCPHSIVRAGIITLLGKGLSVNTMSNVRQTPLHLSLEAGEIENALLLLEHNAETHPQDQHGVTPLHLAAGIGDLSMVRTMCDRGADVNLADDEQRTAIIHALLSGHEEAATHLIEMGAAFDVPDRQGHVPLQLALEAGLTTIVPTLLDTGPDITGLQVDVLGMTIFHTAVKAANITNVKAILTRWHGTPDKATPKLEYARDVPDKDGITPLLTAVAGQNLEMCRLLLQYRAEVGCQEEAGGNTALHLAVSQESSAQLVEALLEGGGSDHFDVQNGEGASPFHIACETGNVPAIQMLLKAGVDFQVKDHKGKAALDKVTDPAAKEIFRDWSKVKLLYPVEVREVCLPHDSRLEDFLKITQGSVSADKASFRMLGGTNQEPLNEEMLRSALQHARGKALDSESAGAALYVDPKCMACPARVSQDLIDGRYLLDDRSWRWGREASQQLAFDMERKTRVSLKFYPDEPSFVSALALHDNIGDQYCLRIIDTFVDADEELHAIVTEWDDTTLAKMLDTGRLLLPEILVIVRSLALMLDRYEVLGLVETLVDPCRIVRIGRDWKMTNFDHLLPAGQWMRVNVEISGPTYLSPEVASAWRTASEGSLPRVLVNPSLPMWHFGLIIAECFRGAACYSETRGHVIEDLASSEDSQWLVSDQHATELLEGLLVKEPRHRLTAAQVLAQTFVEIPVRMEDSSAHVGAGRGPVLGLAAAPVAPAHVPSAPRPVMKSSGGPHREQTKEMKQLQHRVTELQSQCKDAADKQLKQLRLIENKVNSDEKSSTACIVS